ncbi:hypothetical protein D0B54_00385 [Solimonas sp. K1W22B-7]|uniref:hypothetical protein n=1 Tax=Solimonas sp. K1W22B-7 TaxID=2303331 RepID=UPI000E337048|nr:hypothetical protein [Solimonas sp. K1W22B-7]AXQ27239.1 hypothetical protein D0B54_00385 [Solimonas sp. K1W22B-7]
MQIRALGRTLLAAVIFSTVTVSALAADAVCPTTPPQVGYQPTGVDYAMYSLAIPKDHEACSMSVTGRGDGRRLVVTPNVSNAAMSCPDMFAWKLFVEVILDGWWTRWGDESQNWPDKPYPLCGSNQQPGVAVRCCKPGSKSNDPEHCPTFPGASRAASRSTRVQALSGPASERVRRLRPSFMPELHGATRGLMLAAPGRGAEPAVDPESPGRVIRQDNNELTVRNQVFQDFLFRNNLYNADGVKTVFDRAAANIPANAPYYKASQASFGDGQASNISRIDFPPSAIMIKSNWVLPAVAQRLGIKEDPRYPFVKKLMDNGSKQDIYWLVAFHVSSKDVPNWIWATFEHASMLGRCDMTGCNDSYGYDSADKNRPAGTASNYVAPHTRCDNLVQDSTVFARNLPYEPEAIRAGLKAVFDASGVGTRPAADSSEPSVSDLAWRSYRLKGAQVDFTDATGRPTILGNSITEAGFVNGSSCITCHARAGSDELGPFHPMKDRGVFPLGVFINEMSDYGYGLSARGTPNPAWYTESNSPPRLRVLQTDFIWGFLNARPLGQAQ